MTYTDDMANRLKLNRLKLTRTFEKWTRFGCSKEVAFYTYNKNRFLISTTDKDEGQDILIAAGLQGQGGRVEIVSLQNAKPCL